MTPPRRSLFWAKSAGSKRCTLPKYCAQSKNLCSPTSMDNTLQPSGRWATREPYNLASTTPPPTSCKGCGRLARTSLREWTFYRRCYSRSSAEGVIQEVRLVVLAGRVDSVHKGGREKMATQGMLMRFPQLNVEVKARLLAHLAPKTCAWVWDALKQPIENEVWHVHFLGRAVTCRYSIKPPEHRIPPENLTITPASGDIALVNFTEESGRSRGLVSGDSGSPFEPRVGPGTYAGFDMFYGPDSRMLIPKIG